MKKIILFAALMMFAAVTFSQKIILANYTDTLTDAQTKYYAAPGFSDLTYGSFGVYVDHLTGSADSTTVDIQGSFDNSTWVTMGYSGASATVTPTSASPTSFNHSKFTTTSAGLIWNISGPLVLPYYRLKVQHFVTGTVRVKGWLYKKK